MVCPVTGRGSACTGDHEGGPTIEIQQSSPAAGSRVRQVEEHALRALVRRYDWVHTSLGIFGNVAFLLGSVCFLFESWKTVGVWLFIAGAAGMLVGSLGQALVGRQTVEQDEEDHDPDGNSPDGNDPDGAIHGANGGDPGATESSCDPDRTVISIGL